MLSCCKIVIKLSRITKQKDIKTYKATFKNPREIKVLSVKILEHIKRNGRKIGKITPLNADVKLYTYQSNNPGSISKNPVNNILEDRVGHLWEVTVEGGLNLQRNGRNFFGHLRTV